METDDVNKRGCRKCRDLRHPPCFAVKSNAPGQEVCAPASERSPCSAVAHFHVEEAQSHAVAAMRSDVAGVQPDVVLAGFRVAEVRPRVVLVQDDSHEEAARSPV